MNNKQLAEALRAIDMRALWLKDRAAVLNAAEALELREAQSEALIQALEYIDAIPKDVVAALPAMPGFNRDTVDALITAPAQSEALKADAKRCRALRIASVSNNADFSEAMLIAVPEDVRKGRRNMTESEWNVSIDFAISAANKGDCHE
ncbi:hypothetical protein [Robbsia andropogonis]|uniref:hypothetical protein n=1 Tax=Robbsia andropogonis TaxID=28092 RepID=UPI0004661324|nr:hypothetical protein [Robbsia andropogonis]